MTPSFAVLVVVTLLRQAAAHGTHEHGHHHHDHDHDEHAAHDHDHAAGLHDHHEVMPLSAKEYEAMVANDKHVWAVKFYSGMCGACKSFKPAFMDAHKTVDGLHWAAIDIDNKSNIGLAKRMGVLDEGIPNVKLVNVQETPLSIVAGDTPSATDFAKKLTDTLATSGAKKDDAGFYLSRSRAEL